MIDVVMGRSRPALRPFVKGYTGYPRLLGLPAGELAGLVVGLGAILGRRAERLVDRLVSARTWHARFALLDEVLYDLAAGIRAPPGWLGGS